MEKQYAQALLTMAHSTDEATLVQGLVKTLKADGRMKLLPGIVRELKLLSAREAKLAPVLEVSSSKEEAAAKAVLKKEGIEVSETRVTPSLIQGWRVRANGLLWDHSAKRSLLDIYKHITT